MAIVATCPDCKGTGKVPKQLPFRANPKARATHADKLGTETCSRCGGSGRIGVERKPGIIPINTTPLLPTGNRDSKPSKPN